MAITGSFSKGEAEDLVAVLNRGAFPVEVVAQEARIVSPSAGAESLDAAIIAGIVGILLVLAMLFAYYRWMTLVILLALGGVGTVRVRRRVAHLRLDELRPERWPASPASSCRSA